MPTELLHGLYDGGHGAGLNDYWKLMQSSPLGAGIFLWVLTDEGVVRTDRNGEIDVAGNRAPDGIVGPYREKEGSFYTIREIWSPVHIGIERLPEDFNGQIEVENRYDFTNLQDCKFKVKLGEFPRLYQETQKISISFSNSFMGPDIEPHASGFINFPLPENWHDADLLYLTAFDPSGCEIWTWSWYIKKANYYCNKYIQERNTNASTMKVIEEGNEIHIQAGNLVLNFPKDNGELANVTVGGKKISLDIAPKLLGGNASVSKINYSQMDNTVLVTMEYEGNMNYINWLIYPTGWIELDYEFELEGRFNLFGIDFNYPESKMKSMRWLGKGPYRVWQNRTKGGQINIWSNNYKNHTPGVTWDYPEFKGYYRNWRWVVFSTDEGKITIVNGTDDLYLGVYKPNDGPDPRNTRLDVPDSGIALLHGIPPIGTKFIKPEQLGPEGQKTIATGKYKGKIYLRFYE